MECPNCQFQNAPGTASCLRCRGRLDLAGVDFVPPRAGDASLALRVRRRAGRRARLWGERVDRGAGALSAALRAPVPDDRRWSAVLWSIVPGLGSVHVGERVLGWTLFSIWGLLLALWLLTIGDGISWLFLAGAVSVHSTAVVVLFGRALGERNVVYRMLMGLVAYMLVAAIVYAPAGWALGRVVRVVPVQMAQGADGAVRAGDVLLYTGAWMRPAELARGDLVVFEVAAGMAGGAMLREGLGVGRIVGLPGERVTWKKEGERFVLRVDGVVVPPSMYPIAGMGRLEEFDIQSLDGSYTLLPTSIAANDIQAAGFAAGIALDRSRVPPARIIGRVLFRLRPWLRFGPVGLEPQDEEVGP